MPNTSYPRDRFDDVPRDPERVGAHRAPRPRMRWLVLALWWILAVAVLTGGGILAFLALSNVESIDLPDPPATEQREASPEGVIDTDYFVLVLNGTSEAEASDEVRQQVLDAGWGENMVADLASDATDFQTTTVFYVDEEDEAAAIGLADELGISSVDQSADFDEQSEGGLTVVVGVDRLSAE